MTTFLTVFGATALFVFGVLAVSWVIEGIALAYRVKKDMIDGGYLKWCRLRKRWVIRRLEDEQALPRLNSEMDDLRGRVSALEDRLERVESRGECPCLES